MHPGDAVGSGLNLCRCFHAATNVDIILFWLNMDIAPFLWNNKNSLQLEFTNTTVKFLKIGTSEISTIILLNLEQFGFLMVNASHDPGGRANNVDHDDQNDQTAPSSLILVCTVCQGLTV